MKEKIKLWLSNNKKDIKILSIAFILGFLGTFIFSFDMMSSFGTGLGFAVAIAFWITAYRLIWKKWIVKFWNGEF